MKSSPMDVGPLGVHKIELMIQTSPGLSNGRSVGQHAYSPGYLSQISSRYDSGRLVVDTDLAKEGIEMVIG